MDCPELGVTFWTSLEGCTVSGGRGFLACSALKPGGGNEFEEEEEEVDGSVAYPRC